MTIYYQDDAVTLLLGNAATVCATLEPQSIQTVVTSPPYFDLRDYLEHPGNWGTLDGRRGLLLAMLDALETTHEADTAHDVALERAAVLRVLSGDLEWAIKVDASERGYIERLIVFIESGDHWKDGA